MRTARGNQRRGTHTSADYIVEVTTRSRSARRRRRRNLSFWTLRLVFLAALGVGSFYAFEALLDRFFFSNPTYQIRSIKTELDQVLTRNDLKRITGLEVGRNIFTVDLAEIDQRLREIDMVQEVYVSRQLPDTITLRLESRRPVAWIAESVQPVPPSLMIDATGTIMRPKKIRKAYYQLPMIYGVDLVKLEANDPLHHRDVQAALDLLARVSARRNPLLQVRSLDVRRGYAIEIINHQNARIMIQPTNLAQQLARLEKLLNHCQETGRVLESVNLIVDRNMPVRFALMKPPAEPLNQGTN